MVAKLLFASVVFTVCYCCFKPVFGNATVTLRTHCSQRGQAGIKRKVWFWLTSDALDSVVAADGWKNLA